MVAASLLVTLQALPVFGAAPLPPVITEPAFDGQQVYAGDVHMETGPMEDPDGDGHLGSDWEIWLLSPLERVWSSGVVDGLERVHIHLGDGTFEGSHAGRTALFFDDAYRLLVRHQDSTGVWSAPALRHFTTAPEAEVLPMQISDVATLPAPDWEDEEGNPVTLPGGSSPGLMRMDSGSGDLLLEVFGHDGGNIMHNPGPLPSHVAVRLRLAAGDGGLALPGTQFQFADESGTERDIYLPPVLLSPGFTAWFWISENGSSYWADSTDAEPDFSDLARGTPVPWKLLRPGFSVEVFARGFQLPVNLAFVPEPGPAPDDPLLYVTELYGTIKVVSRDGTVGDYATNLLNFDPTGPFPGSGEQGLAGIAVDPLNGDVLATMLYDAAPPNGPHYPKVVRFTSNDGGRTAATQTTIMDFPGELQGQSHFISHVSMGPDRRLYIHMGDGFDPSTALDLSSFRGKVLRARLDGGAPLDNPFYDGPPLTARDYVYAYGFRNPFGGAWRASDGGHYEVENGPDINDRLARVRRGTSYGWDGDRQTMRINATYNWNPTHAPVNIAFVQPETFGGSGFPASRQGHAFVTESGPTWAEGPQSRGKRIAEFELSPDGSQVLSLGALAEYTGSGRATAVGLAAGPDGLYFTDLYKDQQYNGPTDRGANVLLIRYVGAVDFSADFAYGHPPFQVSFTDLSDVPDPIAWSWDFGDGGTSTDRHPNHIYTQNGAYTVRLEVTGSGGVSRTQKQAYIVVGESNGLGLRGDYFDGLDFGELMMTRLDPTVDFNWRDGPPEYPIPQDQFSVRWRGRVRADFSQTYTFYAITSDGVRLWLDGSLLIDRWVDQGPTESSGARTLQAGREYDLVMEYYDNWGDAVARLQWSAPSVPRQAIPSANLIPPFPTALPDPRAAASPGAILFVSAGGNPLRRPLQATLRAASGGPVRLSLHDVAGREVARYVDRVMVPEEIEHVRIEPSGVPSGVYFLRLAGGGTVSSRRLTIVR